MPSPAMSGTAKTHSLEQMDENMFGPLPRRDLQAKQLGSSNPLQGHKPYVSKLQW